MRAAPLNVAVSIMRVAAAGEYTVLTDVRYGELVQTEEIGFYTSCVVDRHVVVINWRRDYSYYVTGYVV